MSSRRIMMHEYGNSPYTTGLPRWNPDSGSKRSRLEVLQIRRVLFLNCSESARLSENRRGAVMVSAPLAVGTLSPKMSPTFVKNFRGIPHFLYTNNGHDVGHGHFLPYFSKLITCNQSPNQKTAYSSSVGQTRITVLWFCHHPLNNYSFFDNIY